MHLVIYFAIYEAFVKPLRKTERMHIIKCMLRKIIMFDSLIDNLSFLCLNKTQTVKITIVISPNLNGVPPRITPKLSLIPSKKA